MAFCTSPIVIALAGFIVLQATSSAASPLYTYGVPIDIVYSYVKDGWSGPIPLYSNIILFGNVSSSLYVNMNGLLSFKSPVTSDNIPVNLPVVDGNPFLAPFWVAVNNAIAGSIYYRQSNDSALLSQATSDIRSYFSIPSFSASLVFVATWEFQAFYDSVSALSWWNRFQAVLCSNGSLTFVMFNYINIEWSLQAASGGSTYTTGALVGLNSGYKTGYYKIPSIQTGFLSADIAFMKSTSNVNFPGRWVFRVDKLHPEGPKGVVGNVEASNILTKSSKKLYSDLYDDANYREAPILLAGDLCRSDIG